MAYMSIVPLICISVILIFKIKPEITRVRYEILKFWFKEYIKEMATGFVKYPQLQSLEFGKYYLFTHQTKLLMLVTFY